MRLPLVPQLSTKDGVTNSNSRLTNVVKETAENGELACVRPGLKQVNKMTGSGQGMVSFNDSLLSVYDGTIYDGNEALTSLYGGPPSIIGYDTGGVAAFDQVRQTIFEANGIFYNVQNYSIYVSPDGEYWDEYALPVTASVWLAGAALGTFVLTVAGNGDIAYSSDSGQNWTVSATTLTGCSNATSNGSFIILTKDDYVYRTTDGVNLTQKATPSVDEFWTSFRGNATNGLVYGLSRKIGSGLNQQVFAWSSDNCTSWTSVEIPLVQAATIDNFYEWTSYTYDATGQKFYLIGRPNEVATIDKATGDVTTQLIPVANGVDSVWRYITFTDVGLFVTNARQAIRSDDGVTWGEPFDMFPNSGDDYAVALFGLTGTLSYYGRYSPPDNPNYVAYRVASPVIYDGVSGDFFDFAQSTL